MSGSASLAVRIDCPQATGRARFPSQGLESVLTARLYTMNNDQAGGTPRVNDPTNTLSEGQKSCLRLVAQGMSSKEIAKQTGLTPQTVDTYVKASLARLGASNRREAARTLVAWEAAHDASANGETVDQIADKTSGSADAPGASDGRGWFTLPPLGGGYQDLSWSQKTYQALQVAAVAAATIVGVALGIAGLFHTFG